MRPSFVAMFHQVNDPIWFEDLLVYLGRKYGFVDADQVLSALQTKRYRGGCCHLSFDDGHKSFYETALPVLIKHRIPATLFISPEIVESSSNYWFQTLKTLPQLEFNKFLRVRLSGQFDQRVLASVSNISIFKCLQYREISSLLNDFSLNNGVDGDSGQNLNTGQIREIVDSGLVEVGAHTVNHPILANEDDDVAEDEISQSILHTKMLSERPVRLFACPNGGYGSDFGEREIRILKQNGILMNFSTTPDHLGKRYDAFRVPRIGISRGNHQFISAKVRFSRLWYLVRDQRNPNSEINQRKRLDAARL